MSPSRRTGLRPAGPRKLWHIALACTLALGLSGASAEDGPYPVWWSPVLELDSLDHIDARLEREIWPGDAEGLPLAKTEGETRKEVSASNCLELERWVREGYHGIGSNGFALQLYNQALCRSIEMMRRAEPAERSFLHDFRLDEDSIHVLPALVNVGPPCELWCRQSLANHRRISLSRFEPVTGVAVKSDEEIKVWTIEWVAILTILARGDFNGDGLDDLLMLANTGGTVGTWGGADTFVLTRDAPGAVLTVQAQGSDRCARAECDATYDYPRVLLETDPRFGAALDLPERLRPITFGVIGGDDYPMGFIPANKGPPYPVWWMPLMGIEYREKINRDLGWETWLKGEPTILEIESVGHMVKRSTSSCRSLLMMLKRGYRLAAGYRSHLPIIAHCHALEALKQIGPATVTHLRDLVLDDQVMEVLPAALGVWTAPCPACQARAFNESRISWARFAAERAANHQSPSFSDGSAYRLEILDERTLRVRMPFRTIEVQFLAGGDYDGDGLDDVLVRRDVLDGAAAYEGSTLFILSRESPEAVFRVVTANDVPVPPTGD